MEKVDLLSKAEMRNVMGGVIDGDTLYETCLTWVGSLSGLDSDEYYIVMRMIENQCARFTIAIP